MLDFLTPDIIELSKWLWSHAVLILMIFFQWNFIREQNKIAKDKDMTMKQIWINILKQTTTIDKVIDLSLRLEKNVDDQTTKFLKSIWKTKLENACVQYIGKRCVLAACYEKLKFLEDMLDLDDITHNIDLKKKQIRSQLIRFSNELYLDPLNAFTTDKWLLWDWIAENFQMEDFLSEIYRVFFDTQIEKNKKRKLFLTTMVTYQNDMWEVFKD